MRHRLEAFVLHWAHWLRPLWQRVQRYVEGKGYAGLVDFAKDQLRCALPKRIALSPEAYQKVMGFVTRFIEKHPFVATILAGYGLQWKQGDLQMRLKLLSPLLLPVFAVVLGKLCLSTLFSLAF